MKHRWAGEKSARTVFPRNRALGLLVALGVMLSGSIPARGQGYSVLYSFECGPNDGTFPDSSLVRDAAGNLYGTTGGGGAYGYGTVFELSASDTEAVLHSFGLPGDGEEPSYTSLLLDSAGNLYGTTVGGGTFYYGVAYRLASDGAETILHNFTGQDGDGANPYGGLTRDASGNLYGTTLSGGSLEYGTVYKLTAAGRERVLYSFSIKPDGAAPVDGLVLDSAGNLHGTTSQGGSAGRGTVFSLSPTGKETQLHSFTGTSGDGSHPYAGLVRDAAGNLYGTTLGGGISSNGTVFKVSATGQETVPHRFAGPPDGTRPVAGLVQDSAGNVFGTTTYGGSGPCRNGTRGCGVIFEVTRGGQETVLYSFEGTPDGSAPIGGLALDKAGNLYGTTSSGGTYGCGTVFEYTP